MSKRTFIIVVLSILCLSGLARYIYMEELGNFHAVEEGILYRSAQLDKDELVKYIDKYQIKSILNLRGKKQASKWYKEEAQVAKQKGVKVLFFHLSPRKKSPLPNWKKLCA
ncbi:MAG: hypothetical protein DRG76_09645 [Deltaproteobacteria bacterium]|nr:MAG: hypothetical protein DRG76_09645 [Deltaproteobacteria bacterium]